MTEADKCKATAIIEEIGKEFLTFVWSETPPNPAALRERCNRITRLAESAGAFDAWDIAWLFNHLEQVASREIAKATALVQTTRPDALSPYGLPPQLIENAKLVATHRSIQNARDHLPDVIAEKAFKAWAKSLPKECRCPANSEAIRGLPGYQPHWGQTDETIKDWWKKIYPEHKFKRGRPSKKI